MPTVELRTSASPDAVWGLLVDLDAWPKWGPSLQRAELSEPGPLRRGSHGRLWTPVGVVLPFTITEFEDRRYWAWEVAGVRATRHEVVPTPDGCRVAFGVPWWAPAYLSVCAIALRRIDKMAR
jgi:hypothetical protein